MGSDAFSRGYFIEFMSVLCPLYRGHGIKIGDCLAFTLRNVIEDAGFLLQPHEREIQVPTNVRHNPDAMETLRIWDTTYGPRLFSRVGEARASDWVDALGQVIASLAAEFDGREWQEIVDGIEAAVRRKKEKDLSAMYLKLEGMAIN